MLSKGKYSVWMRTSLAEGMGVVVLAPDGKLSGGDTILAYTGHWRAEGEEFEATVFATRHSPGPGAFGELDALEVILTGAIQGWRHGLVQGHLEAGTGLDVGGHARPHGPSEIGWICGGIESAAVIGGCEPEALREHDDFKQFYPDPPTAHAPLPGRSEEPAPLTRMPRKDSSSVR